MFWLRLLSDLLSKRKTASPANRATDHFLVQYHGAEGQTRTADTRIFSPLLYQLSYLGTAVHRLRRRVRVQPRAWILDSDVLLGEPAAHKRG